MSSNAGSRKCEAVLELGLSADARRLILALYGEMPDEPSAADSSGNLISESHPSFDTVLRQHHRKVYNLIYRLLGDLDEAADLTQETFVKAYGAYPRFRGRSQAIYPWLCQIAVNGCKNKFRELGRRNQYEVLSLDESVETEDSSLGIQIADESANPAELVTQHELEAKIQEAIQALPPEYRVVIVLRDMNGLSYREIADATGLTMDTVKVRLFRARGVLRKRLSQYISDS